MPHMSQHHKLIQLSNFKLLLQKLQRNLTEVWTWLDICDTVKDQWGSFKVWCDEKRQKDTFRLNLRMDIEKTNRNKESK